MKNLTPLFLAIWIACPSFGKEIKLSSPDNKTEIRITVNSGLSLTTSYQSQMLFTVENIYLDVKGGDFKGALNNIRSEHTRSVNQPIFPEIREKYGEIQDNFNELTLGFKGNYSFTIRAYNNGVAYRFNTTFQNEVIINHENFDLHFADGDSIYLQKSTTFNSSYETPYEYGAVKDVKEEGYACLPVLLRKENGTNIIVSESDLKDYPGLWLKATGTSTMISAFPGYPESFKSEGSPYVQGQVQDHGNIMAKVEGSRTYPWRIFAMAKNDAELLHNTLVYQLASPSEIEDVSWIEPGVVTFDWWGRRNIYGVDFKSGINTETAKYFIDFCADYGFAYFLFDDGWSKQDNLLEVHPDLDIRSYGQENSTRTLPQLL